MSDYPTVRDAFEAFRHHDPLQLDARSRDALVEIAFYAGASCGIALIAGRPDDVVGLRALEAEIKRWRADEPLHDATALTE